MNREIVQVACVLGKGCDGGYDCGAADAWEGASSKVDVQSWFEVYRPHFEYMDGRVCVSASVLFLSSVDSSSFLIAAKCGMSHGGGREGDETWKLQERGWLKKKDTA